MAADSQSGYGTTGYIINKPPPEGPEHAAFWDNFNPGGPRRPYGSTPVSGGSTSKPTVVSAPKAKKGRARRARVRNRARAVRRRR
jgi:hypothetical protein